MKLMIMRHGEAGSGANDYNRTLTSTGREDVRRVARMINGTEWNVREIRTSPLVRTRETGEELQNHLSPSNQRSLSVEDRLAPGFDMEEALSIFFEVDPNAVALWVFHMPDVARLASALTGLRESGFYFSPGSVLALNIPVPHPADRGMVVWQLQPEYLRRVFSAG